MTEQQHVDSRSKRKRCCFGGRKIGTDGFHLHVIAKNDPVVAQLVAEHSGDHGFRQGRGQLTVYVRLVDVPLPMIYGPTADERW